MRETRFPRLHAFLTGQEDENPPKGLDWPMILGAAALAGVGAFAVMVVVTHLFFPHV